MIDPAKLSPEVKSFIKANEHSDVPSLLLKYKSIDGVPISSIADQIIGRRKAKTKLPTYFALDEILYPPAINLEQTSSEKTARFKATMIASLLLSRNISPDLLVDLTGGFGIDSSAFAQCFDRVIHVEPNEALQSLARYNHALLHKFSAKASHISYANQTAEEFLKTTSNASAVFIDPSRRSGSQKVFSFHDCQPDVTVLQDDIIRHASLLMIKASPMLDIQLALGELRHVTQVYVVAVDNEVRELLFAAERESLADPLIFAIDLAEDELSSMKFRLEEEQQAESTFSELMTYVYEPNAAVLKAGAFKLPCRDFNVNKLHVNTHLYTAGRLEQSFPGRIFRVVSTLKADSRKIRDHFPEGKANIIVRNYPSSPDALKKKLKLSDGGERYLLAFTSMKGPELIAAERLK
ncbi:MAG: SAM-dependent methyltransferase [Chryseolinea sp.]